MIKKGGYWCNGGKILRIFNIPPPGGENLGGFKPPNFRKNLKISQNLADHSKIPYKLLTEN